MRISVVIIVYNLEAYIGQAVDSVLGQTRQADEVIVVDDCSTDQSAERVKAYGNRVRYLRMPSNSGALLTALHGVKAARGDVISMLDGDDYWADNKLEVVEREFSANPNLMLLSHHHERVGVDGSRLEIRDGTHRNIASIQRTAKSAEHLSTLLKSTVLEQRGYWLGSAYSFRRDLFDIEKFEAQIGRYEAERLRDTYLDLTIAPFLALTNPYKDVGYTPDTQFFYRIHDQGSMGGNFTSEKANRSALKARRINELIELIFRENHAPQPLMKRRQLILDEYDFLSALYTKRFGRALRLYVRLARNFWNWRQLSKETQRLVAVSILGPEKFLMLKNRAGGS